MDNEIILSKQKVLKDHPEWKNVVVKPDLTTNQPDYAKKQHPSLDTLLKKIEIPIFSNYVFSLK